ncbi:hypothetical protein [Kingella sp. (in: b-proteobacteria)]|nr:hypothetical protein [Kingella sp. (in: b-proteobacteria)]MDO4657563.1 hypothetical protein [Kingella sp. (in: b-proteobacteria)]
MFARCQRQPENHSADPVYKIAWLIFKGSLKTKIQILFTKPLGLQPKAA